jgi:hypothetical protein
MKKPVNNLFHPIDSIISSCIRINFCNLHSPTYSDRTPQNLAIPLDSSGKHPLPRTTSRIAPLPPHEQWLVTVVVGAVAMGSGGLQSPPHEQWLMRLGVGGALAAYIVVHSHPRSTPRAVAREAGVGGVLSVISIGGGGVMQPVAPEPPCEQALAAVGAGAGVCCARLRSSAWYTPANHPMSSCSGAGGGWCVAWVVLGPPGCGVIVGSSWWVLGLPLVVVGPWCPFLVVISAHRHSLTLPNLQAGACSGGHGW